MILRGRDRSGKMPCESCAVQFSVFKRKRVCSECERYYCSGCLRRGGGTMCAPCRVLSTRPLSRQDITHLKVRDLQCFLQRQNISTRGCVEKEELVSLCVSHVNSSAYKRRGQRGNGSPFSTLKGFTNNINEFLNSAFDLRAPAQPAPPPTPRNCYNSTHSHTPTPSAPSATTPPRDASERFTLTPGGERDIFVPVPDAHPDTSPSNASEEHVETADCLEIADLDDQGWEFLNAPAHPLPTDSDVLLSATLDSEALLRAMETAAHRGEVSTEADGSRGSDGLRPARGDVERAASELDLRRSASAAAADAADTASLQDDSLMDHNQGPGHITLEQFKEISELDALSVKQLKELLTRNRVEFRGCLERAELLQRARTLWRNHAHNADDVENLPLEECCKICMAAPLECVLLECGHIAACTRCSKQLAECPICRQYVVRAVRVFRS